MVDLRQIVQRVTESRSSIENTLASLEAKITRHYSDLRNELRETREELVRLRREVKELGAAKPKPGNRRGKLLFFVSTLVISFLATTQFDFSIKRKLT